MSQAAKSNRRAVRQERADDHLLVSLVAFGVTVVGVRLFLDLSGYPQIGNSVLHIAHALWGALLLFIAVLLPLLLTNPWAIQLSALLSGVGIGLFIDEVGKFITQKNDYFFPPALPLIYGFFLLTVFVYLYFRRSNRPDARKAMYHSLDRLKEILDGELDQGEAVQIERQLALARRSEDPLIGDMAGALEAYLRQAKQSLPEAKPGYWARTVQHTDALGRRLGRRLHRRLLSIMLILWAISAVLSSILLAFVAFGAIDLQDPSIRSLFSSSELTIVDSSFWLTSVFALQVLIALLASAAAFIWLWGNEARGQKTATFALIVSLVLLQPLMFYTSQLSALGGTLYQFAFLLLLLLYRRWYLRGPSTMEHTPNAA